MCEWLSSIEDRRHSNVSERTPSDNEDVRLLIRVKVSKRRHSPVIFGTEKVGRYILKSKRAVLSHKKPQKCPNIEF